MWTALLLAVGLAAPVLQDPQAREAPPALVQPDDPDFTTLLNAYQGKLRDHDELRIKVGRKELDPQKLPPHPAIAWFLKFRALSEQDSGAALGWMLSNLAKAVQDDAERVRIARETLDRLLSDHADEPAVLEALAGVRSLLESLGEERAIEMCKAIVDRTAHPEIEARALWTQAWILAKRHPDDPAKSTEAHDIQLSIVYGYPGTEAAKEATNALLPVIESQFLAAERAWVAEVERLQASGAALESWPAQPMHAFHNRFLPFASAGNRVAKKWVNQLYLAYAQAERQGVAVGLSWLANALGANYGFDPGAWTGVRIGVLRILFRQFPNEPQALAWLESLRRDAEGLPVEMLAGAVEPLLAKNKSREVCALATVMLAQSHQGRGDQKSCEQALALYQHVIDLFPGESESGIAYEAANLKKDLERVMPGSPAPPFSGKDAEGIDFRLADYAGRVVAFEFWSASVGGLPAADGAARNDLIARMADRPFHWIGANVDSATPKAYYENAMKSNVRWRSALLQSRADPALYAWGVRKFPTTYVIDAAGMIRGRNLPWDEMVALIERLVAETTGNAPKKK